MIRGMLAILMQAQAIRWEDVFVNPVMWNRSDRLGNSTQGYPGNWQSGVVEPGRMPLQKIGT